MIQQLLPYKTYFFVAFAILIPVLGYAVFLQWGTLKSMVKSNEEKQKAIEEREANRQASLRESIRIISMATVQEQCEISEAVIRLANLLPPFSSVDHESERFKPLFLMYEEIKEFKTHNDRKELKAAERFREDKLRFAVEDKYHKDILEVCQSLYDEFKENS